MKSSAILLLRLMMLSVQITADENLHYPFLAPINVDVHVKVIVNINSHTIYDGCNNCSSSHSQEREGDVSFQERKMKDSNSINLLEALLPFLDDPSSKNLFERILTYINHDDGTYSEQNEDKQRHQSLMIQGKAEETKGMGQKSNKTKLSLSNAKKMCEKKLPIFKVF